MERFPSLLLVARNASMNQQAVVDAQPPFGRLLGMTFTHVSPDRVLSELVVREELTNRNGVLHGGAVMGLADNLGGTASFLNLPAGATTSTIESKTNFFAACALGEKIQPETTPAHRGRPPLPPPPRAGGGGGGGGARQSAQTRGDAPSPAIRANARMATSPRSRG